MTWDQAVAVALALPGTELSTYYRDPAVKIAANGRAFLTPGHEAHDSFCLLLDRDTVAVLLETDPDGFYQTPHYAGYGAVLVRYDAADGERVRAMIERAYAQAAAKPKARGR